MPDRVWPDRTATRSGSGVAAGSPLTTGAGPSVRGPQAAISNVTATTRATAPASRHPLALTFRIFPPARPTTRKQLPLVGLQPNHFKMRPRFAAAVRRPAAQTARGRDPRSKTRCHYGGYAGAADHDDPRRPARPGPLRAPALL